MSESRSLVSRIPTLVRAPIVGFAIQIVGVMPFLLLTQVNLEYGRQVPWAALFEAGLLWLLWRYLQGAGWPASTSKVRRRWLRAGAVESHLLPPTIVAGLLYGLTVASLSIFTALWKPMPVEAYATILALARAPAVTGFLTLLMVAISAGIVEEAAFRGYMQRPIEDRHGPVVAITVVALLFALAHVPAGPVLLIFTAGALGWGLLARLSGSIIPGIIVHALVDAGFLAWIWGSPDEFEALLHATAGTPDEGWRVTSASIAAVLVIATAAAFFWLARRATPDRVGKSR